MRDNEGESQAVEIKKRGVEDLVTNPFSLNYVNNFNCGSVNGWLINLGKHQGSVF